MAWLERLLLAFLTIFGLVHTQVGPHVDTLGRHNQSLLTTTPNSAASTDGPSFTEWISELPPEKVDWSSLIFLHEPDNSDTNYAKDKRHVYFCCYVDGAGIVPGADPETFHVLSLDYAVDAHTVYTYAWPFAGAEPSTFIVMAGGYYAEDKRYVYADGERVLGADPASFQVRDSLHPEDGQDRLHRYHYSKIVE